MANPQTQDVSNPEELYAINAKWVNGVAPGYWPTAGAGLHLNIGVGASFDGTLIRNYAGGSLLLVDNTTNYVFLDSAASYAPGSNTTGFTSTLVPIATVITAAGAITSIVDNRLSPTIAGGGGSSTLAADTDVAIATPANRDMLMYKSSDSKWHNVTQESLDYAADTGIANAYAVALAVAPTLVVGTRILFQALHTNTGASTLAINGGAAKNIFKKTSSSLVAGDILANQIIEAVYDGTNFQISGNGATGSSPVVIGFVINNGAVGNNVGPMLQPSRAGQITKCAIVIKSSDGSVGLTFRIKQNGVDVFTSDPVVGAGTAAGTTSSSTSLTTNPLTVAVSDVFQIDITSGSPNWAFTAQLET